MFVFVATALAGTIIGWPCQRLNWGWRNVWRTCSINSFVPITGTTTEVAAQIPTGFRQTTDTPSGPARLISAAGIFTPLTGAGGSPAIAAPTLLCISAPATGTGATANLRNRCRRAIDAYGALVKACAARMPSRAPVAPSRASRLLTTCLRPATSPTCRTCRA